MIRLRYWQNPETGEERVYLRGLGETLWCDADGYHTPAGRPTQALVGMADLALMALIGPAFFGAGRRSPAMSMSDARHFVRCSPWRRTWTRLSRMARREHERRIAAAAADLRRYTRHRAVRIFLGRAWLRLELAWRWVLGRCP